MESDQLLRRLIVFAPDAQVPQAAHGVIGAVRPALVFGHYRDAVGIVTVGPHARRGVDRKLGVIAQLGTGKTLGTVLVIERRPFSRKIDLRENGHGR